MVAQEVDANINEFGQPVGLTMNSWTPPLFPSRKTLRGSYCDVKPLDPTHHAKDLWDALSDDPSDARWTYTTLGPYLSYDEFKQWSVNEENSLDRRFHAIVVDGHAVGLAAYSHIDRNRGTIEIGPVFYSLRLAKTRAAAEAMHLLAANAFQLGYRRYEWRCDSLNLPSHAAATRLGFTYEGTMRQDIIYKGRSADSMTFSIIISDWNAGLKDAYSRWLDPNNFDENDQQKLKLSELTEPFVHARP